MKKTLSLILAVLMLLSVFAACGETEQTPEITENPADSTLEPSQEEPTVAVLPDEEDEGDKEAQEILPPQVELSMTDPNAQQGQAPSAPSTPSTPSTPAQKPSTPGTPAAPQTPASSTPAKNISTEPVTTALPKPASSQKNINILFFGDAFITQYNFGDILGSFLQRDNIFLHGEFSGGSNVGKTSTFGLYEYFDWDGMNIKNRKTNSDSFYNLMDTMKFDYFVCLSCRDRVCSLPEIADKEEIAYREVEKYFMQKNPDSKIVLLLGPGYKKGAPAYDIASWHLNTVAKNIEEHNPLIRSFAERLQKGSPYNPQILDVQNAFMDYWKKYPNGGDLYETTTLRNPSPAGAYYMACVVYGLMFGKSPYGLTEYGFLSEEEATLFQKLAHEYVFKSAPTQKRTESTIATEPVPWTDPRFENEEYPEYFDIFYATATAYRNRTRWVQYDQLNFERVSYKYDRRVTAAGYNAPEEAVPQNFLYLDCSSYGTGVYMEAFDYRFKGGGETGLNRSKSLAQKAEEAVVFYFDGLDKSHTIEEKIAEFVKVIRPGDLFCYSNRSNSAGHTMLYIGGGCFIHCTGHCHTTGGSGDYEYSSNMDNMEMCPGAIQYNNIDVLIDPQGERYPFGIPDIEIKLIRPLSLGIKPNQRAIDRAKNLTDLVVYKDSSAPIGTTVNTGDDVVFTVHVRNIGKENRTVDIVDTLPQGLKLKAGNGTRKITVAPYSEVAYSYVVTVTATSGTINCDTRAGNVPLNSTPIVVARTLTADEQTKLYNSALKVTGADDTSYITKVYKDALGKDVGFTSNDGLFTKIFTQELYNGSSNSYKVKDKKCVPAHLFGGWAVIQTDNLPRRATNVQVCNLVPGDVIVLCLDDRVDNTDLWLYAGNDTFLTVTSGKVHKIASSSEILSFTHTFYGHQAYCVYRPSLQF